MHSQNHKMSCALSVFADSLLSEKDSTKTKPAWFRVTEKHELIEIDATTQAAYNRLLNSAHFPISKQNAEPRTIIAHAQAFRASFIQNELALHILANPQIMQDAGLPRTGTDTATAESIRAAARSLFQGSQRDTRVARRRATSRLEIVVNRIVNQNLLVRYEQFLSTLATLHIREEFTVTDGSTQFAQVVDKIADWVQDREVYNRAHRVVCFSRSQGDAHSNMRLLADSLHATNVIEPRGTVSTPVTNSTLDAPIYAVHDEAVATIFLSLLTSQENAFLQEKLGASHARIIRSFLALRQALENQKADSMPLSFGARQQRLKTALRTLHAGLAVEAPKPRRRKRKSTDVPVDTETDLPKPGPRNPKKSKGKTPEAAVYEGDKMTNPPKPMRTATIADIKAWTRDLDFGTYICDAKAKMTPTKILEALQAYRCLYCNVRTSGSSFKFHVHGKCSKTDSKRKTSSSKTDGSSKTAKE